MLARYALCKDVDRIVLAIKGGHHFVRLFDIVLRLKFDSSGIAFCFCLAIEKDRSSTVLFCAEIQVESIELPVNSPLASVLFHACLASARYVACQNSKFAHIL